MAGFPLSGLTKFQCFPRFFPVNFNVYFQYYHPATKLREGIVYCFHLCVCLSVHRGGPLVTTTYDALDLTVQGPPTTRDLLNLFT